MIDPPSNPAGPSPIAGRPPRRLAGVARLLVYVAAGGAVAGVWTYYARTERWENRYNSIVAIAGGSAPSPFVKRRLPVDAARLIVGAVPADAWRAIRGAIAGTPPLRRALLEVLGWPPEHLPILLTTSALIWASASGFMAASRSIVLRVYDTHPLAADAAGLVLGIGLLGGCASRSYQWYPYDFANAFLSALTLVGMLGRRPWYVLAFAAAVYCKETALLLILARWLIATDPRSPRTLAELAALSALFLAIRIPIGHVYDMPAGASFWFPARNAKGIAKALVFGSWALPILLVAGARLRADWGRFPRILRRLTLLPLILLGVAFFKGWIEELRQYSEAIAICGPLALQWVALELGYPTLFRVKGDEAGPGTAPRPAGTSLGVDAGPAGAR